MKKIISSTILITYIGVTGFSQDLTKESLCKKWDLEKYVVMWVDYEPEENEQNDYIMLKSDMTYSSIDEGILTSGKWTMHADENYFLMYDEKGEGIKFIVSELEEEKMVLSIDLEELDGLDIHFTTKKR